MVSWPRWLRWLLPKPKFPHGPPLAAAVMVHGIYADGGQQMTCSMSGSLFAHGSDSREGVFSHYRIGVKETLELEVENVSDAPIMFRAVAFLMGRDRVQLILPFEVVEIQAHYRLRVSGRMTESGILQSLVIPTYQWAEVPR